MVEVCVTHVHQHGHLVDESAHSLGQGDPPGTASFTKHMRREPLPPRRLSRLLRGSEMGGETVTAPTVCIMTTTPTHAASRTDRLEDFRKLLQELAELSNAEFDQLDIGALTPVDISVRPRGGRPVAGTTGHGPGAVCRAAATG